MGNYMSYFQRVFPSDRQIQKDWRINPIGSGMVEEFTRLIGTMFGSTIDTNFWTATNNGTASASGVASGIATLTSGTSNSGHGSIKTVRPARFVFVNPNMVRIAARITATNVANNTRRWGAFTATVANPPVPQEGFSFEYTGTTLSVCRYVGASQTKIDSGSFNGEVASYTLDTNVHAFEILYFVMGVWFFIDGVLIHKFAPTTAGIAGAFDFPVMASSVNSAGGTSSAVLEVWAGSIFRQGKLETMPAYFHFTTAASTLLKRGAGSLHRITLNNPTGTLITIYDGIDATGAVIGIVNTPATANPMTLDYHIQFFTGLFMVTTGTWDGTIVYE